MVEYKQMNSIVVYKNPITGMDENLFKCVTGNEAKKAIEYMEKLDNQIKAANMDFQNGILSDRLSFILKCNGTITIHDNIGFIEDLNVPSDIGNLISKICLEHGEQARELENLNKHNPLGRLRMLIEYIKQQDGMDTDLLIQCVDSAYDFDK